MLLSAHWVLVLLCGNGSRECTGWESGSLHSTCCLRSDRVVEAAKDGAACSWKPRALACADLEPRTRRLR